jgi:starch synthase (maltosyl-transferring)
MLIYNLFPLLAGHCGLWEPHLKRAASMGFTWIFVNPVQKPGSSGSLYSISDYFQLNPLIIDNSSKQTGNHQLQLALETAKKLGLKVMIDLVINHCAFDSALTHRHPEWFLVENGEIAHPFCLEDGQKIVWGDLVRFNHQNESDPEGLYHYCYQVIEYLLKLGFNGFRCDAAYQVPGQVWYRLINEISKKYPDTVFIAETLGCNIDQTIQTAQAGFDYVFNSSKWWDFQSPWLIEQYQTISKIAPSISFPESHDTERLFQEVNGNEAAMRQRYLFSAFFSAGLMIPIGFEYGFRRRLHVVNTRVEDWESSNIDLCNFITSVNTIKKRYQIFQEDCSTSLVPCRNQNVLLMLKLNASGKAMIILNKDPLNHQHFYDEDLSIHLQLGESIMDVSPEYQLEYIPRPFSCDLRPGQAFVLLMNRPDHMLLL